MEMILEKECQEVQKLHAGYFHRPWAFLRSAAPAFFDISGWNWPWSCCGIQLICTENKLNVFVERAKHAHLRITFILQSSPASRNAGLNVTVHSSRREWAKEERERESSPKSLLGLEQIPFIFTAPQAIIISTFSWMSEMWRHRKQRKLNTGDIFFVLSSCWLSQSLQGCHVCL